MNTPENNDYDGLSFRDDIFNTNTSSPETPASSYDSSYYSTPETTSTSVNEAPKTSGLSIKMGDEPANGTAPTNDSAEPFSASPFSTGVSQTPNSEPSTASPSKPEPVEFNPYSDFDEPFVASSNPASGSYRVSEKVSNYTDDGPTATADMNFRYYYNNLCPFEKRNKINTSCIAMYLTIIGLFLYNFFMSSVSGATVGSLLLSSLIWIALTMGVHFNQNYACSIILIIIGGLNALLPLLLLRIAYVWIVFFGVSIAMFRAIHRVHSDYKYDKKRAAR